jgi:hypothetical protein
MDNVQKHNSFNTNSKGKGKGKVVPVLFLTEHHAMKTYWGSGGIAPRILDLGTRWRSVSVSRPSRFTPGERASDTHSTEAWVGSRAGLDTVVKEKVPSCTGTRIPDHGARSPELYH